MSGTPFRDALSDEDVSAVSSAGLDVTEKTRAGSFLQQDEHVSFVPGAQQGFDILGIEEALRTLPEAAEYYGKNFRDLNREFPADTRGGYFIRVRKGVNLALPLQACLFLKKQGFRQRVHNVVVVEEGARVSLITGCSAAHAAQEGFHLGVSEFFVKEGGYLNFTMIHSWQKDTAVKPMSIATVDSGGTFVSNYLCLRPVKEISMYPTAVLAGEGARASFNSLMFAHPGSMQDIGSRVILRGQDTQAEIVSRAVSRGGTVIARGHIKAEAPGTKGHLECRGLLLTERGTIQAIPEMETDFREVDLSHEAAIGKVSKEEIEYLCSRGFSRDEAQSVIVRGFMDVNILALPDMLKQEVAKLEEALLGANL